jgi:glycine cleavage system protein P-like pyridoxal-binding family
MVHAYLLAVYWRALSLLEFGIVTIFSVANPLNSGIETFPRIVRAALLAESTEYVSPRSATPICAPLKKSTFERKGNQGTYQVQQQPKHNAQDNLKSRAGQKQLEDITRAVCM